MRDESARGSSFARVGVNRQSARQVADLARSGLQPETVFACGRARADFYIKADDREGFVGLLLNLTVMKGEVEAMPPSGISLTFISSEPPT
jgi:hypothetical protein